MLSVAVLTSTEDFISICNMNNDTENISLLSFFFTESADNISHDRVLKKTHNVSKSADNSAESNADMLRNSFMHEFC